jgi:hypothetical protein
MGCFHDDGCECEEGFQDGVLENAAFEPQEGSRVGDIDFGEDVVEGRDMFLHSSTVETHSIIRGSGEREEVHDVALSTEVIHQQLEETVYHKSLL